MLPLQDFYVLQIEVKVMAFGVGLFDFCHCGFGHLKYNFWMLFATPG